MTVRDVLVKGLAGWLDAHKPAASRRVHLFCVSIMWSIVGSALLACGAWWMLRSVGALAVPFLVVAVTIGILKARWVLKRSADRISTRILSRGDGKCLGGFLSWRLWLLVALMAGSGRLLRASPVPLSIVGFVYASVGTALLLASRSVWRVWLSVS